MTANILKDVELYNKLISTFNTLIMELAEVDAFSWSTTSLTGFDYGTIYARPRLARLAQLAETVAIEKPDDENAQRRAQAAMAVVESMGDVPEGDEEDDTRSCSPDRDAAKHPSLPEPPRETSQSTKSLPIEILQLIICHINTLRGRSKQKTLAALSCSCKLLMVIAEEFLYTHPRTLENVKQQWMFLYSLKLEPSRARLVKYLKVLWLHDGSNSQLLIDIASCCPNLSDLVVERGDSLEDSYLISNVDIRNIGALLHACPRLESFRCKSKLTGVILDAEEFADDVELGEQGSLSAPSAYPGFKEAGSNLKRLVVGDESFWLIQSLFPHLSSNLASLTIGYGNHPRGERPLFTLSTQCPHLQELILDYTIAESSDLEQACKNWGSTLHTLKVDSMEEESDWLAQTMPFMTALKILYIGTFCTCTIVDINAIAESKAPLEQIFLEDIESDRGGVANDEMNSALGRMITAHSSRLLALDLGLTKLGPPILQSCKQAKHLRSLDFAVSYFPSASEVDDLLVTCPELDVISRRLTQFSLQWDMWEARINARTLPRPRIVGQNSPDDEWESLSDHSYECGPS